MSRKRKTPVRVGTKWGKLTVLKEMEKNVSAQVKWRCVCECGRIVEAWGYSMVSKKKTACGGTKCRP